MKIIKNINRYVVIGIIFLLNFQITNAVTSFSFSVPEGQGSGLNEFYHGRCVRADVMMDTDGHDTGGADLEINYNNSKIAIVNSDCSTLATTIYTDNKYDNYLNNHVTNNKITLGAYNNPGTSYNSSGRFAYFYFTVLDGAGDYDLDFEFTSGNTTDTNLAETGSGNDILEQADSYTLRFADDDDVPYLNNLNPTSGVTNVQVISNILYRLNDDDAGINFSTLAQSLTGANWGTTNYTAGSGQISHSCHTTNANRVPYCDTTLNPSNNLWYCEQYTVNTTISDLGNPIVHTLNNYTYTFDTEPDNDAPDLINLNPGEGAVNTSSSTDIVFDVRDIATPGSYPGTGVDITTLSVNVSAPGWGSQTYTTTSSEMTVTPTSVNDYGNVYIYNIKINPVVDFPENTLVTVTVDVDDYGCPSINHLYDQYIFTTSDKTSPVCDTFTPEKNKVDIGRGDNITFICRDEGVGIDIDSLSVVVDNILYESSGSNSFTFTGDSSEYFITINPNYDFEKDYAFEVVVNGADFSENYIEQISFGLATAIFEDCKDCKDCNECANSKVECPVCNSCEGQINDLKYEILKEEKKCGIEECEDVKCVQNDTTYKSEYERLNIEDKELFLNAAVSIPRVYLDSIKLEKINNIDIEKGNDSTLNWFLQLFKKNNNIDEVIVHVSDDLISFKGRALPNTKVTLIINSKPIIISGLTNNEGEWEIEIKNIFENGIHTVSTVAVSKDEYITHTKELAKFSIERFNWCILVVILLILIIILLYRKYKKVKNMFKNLEEKYAK